MSQETTQTIVPEGSIPIENNRQVSAITISALCIFVCFSTVGLRMLAKFKIGKKFDASDACIIAALVFNTGLHADMLLMITKGGFGFHVSDVIARFGPDAATLFFKAIMVFALLWNATTCFTKLSILFMYTSIFPVNKLVLVCKFFGLFIILWNTGGIIAGLLICRPFAFNWDRTIPGGKCGSQPNYYMALGIINILAEVALLTLPFPLLYKLQMPLRKKCVVIGMFSIGFATCGITIYRQATLPNLEFDDMTHSGLIATIFSGLEPSVALALSCVPYLRPFFGKNLRQTKTGYTPEGASKSYKDMPSSISRNRFECLDDNASDVQLRPIEAIQDTRVSARHSSDEERGSNKFASQIRVQKAWEVQSERNKL